MWKHVLPLAICLTAFVVSSAFAGDYHNGPKAECSDCHTQHASKHENLTDGHDLQPGGQRPPAKDLLLRATAQELCLSCHDGTNPAAPNVVADPTDTFDWAAGRFPRTNQATATTAHHLGATSPEPAPGGTQSFVLTCTTCHDPHGNSNYRNLRPDPTNSGLPGVAITVVQQVVANGTNPRQVYVPTNITYKSGMSAWCGTCHGTLDPSSGHPVDLTMWGAQANRAKYSSWTKTTLPRVPVESPTDNTIPSHDDEVICLSCHKAHGSTHAKTVIWADGATLNSTCGECH